MSMSQTVLLKKLLHTEIYGVLLMKMDAILATQLSHSFRFTFTGFIQLSCSHLQLFNTLMHILMQELIKNVFFFTQHTTTTLSLQLVF